MRIGYLSAGSRPLICRWRHARKNWSKMISPVSVSPNYGSNIGSMPASVELNATMLENQRWLAQLESGNLEDTRTQATPYSLPRIGIEGAGFFVLGDAGVRVFARAISMHVEKDGRLLDDRGRSVMGFAPAEGAQEDNRGLTALRVPARDLGSYMSYEIDLDGSVWGTPRAVGRKHEADRKVELGRIGIAIFPNPQTLEPVDRDVLVTTPSSGLPHFVPADAPHVGRLHRNPPTPSHEAFLSNLRALWTLSGRTEIEVALAASKDSLARIALNLVR
jgi:flagellar basal body rod protein FlgG